MLYLLDASAILNEPNFEFEKKHHYITTPEALSELRTLEAKTLAENAMHYSLLEIQKAGSGYVEKIRSIVKEKGFTRLSKADISILSLALELREKKQKFSVLTDDYSIQNFLALLEIPFSSVIQGEIQKILYFEKFCPGCNKKFPHSYRKRDCDFCGSRLEKRAKFTGD